jgi:predicted regulator of Ras-like GTPase activity (Roadblock/LC7/MglB family)
MSPLPEPEVVADAVAVRERTVEPSEAAEPPPSAHDAAELARIIQSLQRELLARAVLVTSGERVLASGGSIGGAELAELAQLIAGRVAASGRLMQFLGEPQGVVELVLEEGRDVRVYTVRVTTAVCLTVAAAPSIPLGTLRYRTRQAAEEIVAALR